MKEQESGIRDAGGANKKRRRGGSHRKKNPAEGGQPRERRISAYQPQTNYSRNEYDRILRRCIQESAGELTQMCLSHLADYVRDYRFKNLNPDMLRQKLDNKFLDEILYREMDGFSNLSDLKHNAIVTSFRLASGESPEAAAKAYLKEKYPEARDYAHYFKASFGKTTEKELHLLMRRMNHKAERIYYDSIQEKADFMRIDRMLFEQQKQFESMVLNQIPERVPDLYPLARRMKRHFILHVGPTNSGKTHEALQALKEAQRGIYLAPLRLLAYEIYDRLNGENVPCNMITGEEEIIINGAEHFSATIETLSIYDFFDVAVIDEAQMIADKKRGGAWTRAILGVCAPRVHVCSDPSCVDLITKILEECGDTYEIIRKERMVPLRMDESRFEFPANVKEKDALIVFSKKSVIAVTAELQQAGIQASMIYGNLPYDVRMNEVRRFVSGETKVVVATDAIGMGLNLPIKRIVFLETKKFDGDVVRPLTSSEIKQIAGRAGRRGLYHVGYYNSEYRRNSIRRAIEEKLGQLEAAKLGIPESLISLDMPLSDILMRWSELPSDELYEKADFSEDIGLCRMLEKHVVNKQLLYDLITLGIRSSKKNMTDILVVLGMIEEGPDEDKEKYINQVLDSHLIFYEEELEDKDMEELEDLYLVYDLLYAYLRKFRHYRRMNEVIQCKRECSARIMEILRTQKLETRKCKICGKELSWNYPYATCQECYERAD